MPTFPQVAGIINGDWNALPSAFHFRSRDVCHRTVVLDVLIPDSELPAVFAPIVSIPVGCELAAPVPLQKLFSGEISVKPDVLLQVRPE